MKPCPSCGHNIQINEGFATWCEVCDWNLPTLTESRPLSTWERIEKRMRDTYGRALFEDIQKQPNPFAKKGTSERIATLLSLLIIGFSLAGLVAGVYGLIKWNNSPLIIFICVLILLISWLSRPRPNRLSKQVMSLAAASHPQIHKIIEKMEHRIIETYRAQYLSG